MKEWKEVDHPRDEIGRFTGYGSIAPGSGKKVIELEKDTIKLLDIEIGKSLGAKAKNYNVKDLISMIFL